MEAKKIAKVKELIKYMESFDGNAYLEIVTRDKDNNLWLHTLDLASVNHSTECSDYNYYRLTANAPKESTMLKQKVQELKDYLKPLKGDSYLEIATKDKSGKECLHGFDLDPEPWFCDLDPDYPLHTLFTYTPDLSND